MAIVSVDVDDGPVGAGAKLQVEFRGRPTHDSATFAVNPFAGVTVTVVVKVPPGSTLCGVSAGAVTVKLGIDAPVTFKSVSNTHSGETCSLYRSKASGRPSPFKSETATTDGPYSGLPSKIGLNGMNVP